MVASFWATFIAVVFLKGVVAILAEFNKLNHVPDVCLSTESFPIAGDFYEAQVKDEKPEPAVVKESPSTSQEVINLVVDGLMKVGVKKAKAKQIVKMCNNKCYNDPQDLFVACFPHINS